MALTGAEEALIEVEVALIGVEEDSTEVEAPKEEDLKCKMHSPQEEEPKMTEGFRKVTIAKIRPKNSLLSSRKITATPKINIKTDLMILTRISLQSRTFQNSFKPRLLLQKKMILRTKDMTTKMMVKITKMTMESMERKSSKK